ncbi:hypothetical protein ACLB2K_025096 [Fragaria x ananassa]
MGVKVDHYKVLDLPSGEEGAKLTQRDILKAYRAKALLLHPDKRPDYPRANAEFQQLRSSYEILKDPKSRAEFDAAQELDDTLELEKEYDEVSLVTILILVAALSILYVTQVGILMAKRTVHAAVCVEHWICSPVRNVCVGTVVSIGRVCNYLTSCFQNREAERKT